jgi:SAM-dependent methyltransferase
MHYLDTIAASAIYQTKADIILDTMSQGILDVGCRIGTVNHYLNDHSYQYHGFDTSPLAIAVAMETFPQHTFTVDDWDNLPVVNFKVDMIVFGSVLIYSDNPYDMFIRICDHYKASHAIIHEVLACNNLDLPYVDLDFFVNKYQHTYSTTLSLNIPCGERTITHVQL